MNIETQLQIILAFFIIFAEIQFFDFPSVLFSIYYEVLKSIKGC